jgi:hypothetical protein
MKETETKKKLIAVITRDTIVREWSGLGIMLRNIEISGKKTELVLNGTRENFWSELKNSAGAMETSTHRESKN